VYTVNTSKHVHLMASLTR